MGGVKAFELLHTDSPSCCKCLQRARWDKASVSCASENVRRDKEGIRSTKDQEAWLMEQA